MKIGIVGLGRMGLNLALRATEKGHEVLGYSRSAGAAGREGIATAPSLDDLVAALAPPRVVLLYLPHGDATEQTCSRLLDLLAPADLVIDGGNSHWEDSVRRAGMFAARSIEFLDVGTSGGVSGARDGACFMVGGSARGFDIVRPLLLDLAVDERAVIQAGPSGAGHFTKLVHNGIEFGMVQAIAEGVEMLQLSDYEIDLPALFDNWNHGSVIRSWLVELMGQALAHSDESGLSTYVEDTGEVKWLLEWAMQQDIPTPVTALAQGELMRYRDLESPAAKAVALLRHSYGGHPVHRKSDS